MSENENPILKLTIEFSLDIIVFVEKLEEQKKYVIAKQLMRSGTSIGANVHEAQSAESRADFIHKLKIAHKEAEETSYWLTLCEKAKSYPTNVELKNKLFIIIKILSKIISSSKKTIAKKETNLQTNN